MTDLYYIKDADIPWTDKVSEDFNHIVYKDAYPVVEGHLLFVPKFNTAEIIAETFADANAYGTKQVEGGKWDAFNIGMNCGKEAGQTVMWPHIHLIPRVAHDVKDPVGGVRNTIPGQGNYHTATYKQPKIKEMA